MTKSKPPTEPVNLELFADALADPITTQEYRDLCDGLLLDGCLPAIIDLLTGDPDKGNLAKQGEAICVLVSQGLSVQDISGACGISVPTLKNTMRVVSLPAILLEAVRSETIKRGIAKRLLKLSDRELKTVKAIFKKEGKVTGEQLDELRQTVRQESAEALPDALFQMPTLETASLTALKQQFVDTVSRLREEMGTTALETYFTETLHATPSTLTTA